MTYCWLNGKILPTEEASVNVLDIGLMRGYAIYEALTTYGGKPFMLADHLRRFRASAEAMRLVVPANDIEIITAIAELIKRNGFKETNVKFVLTGGKTIAGIEYDSTKPVFYILAEEFLPVPASVVAQGCKLITHEFQRQYPGYKTANYITGVMIQPARKAAGALEVLFTWHGKISECATSNFFIVKSGTLITPVHDILFGITRKVVLDLARKNGIAVEERDVTVDELATADEALISSSFKEVVPVVKIDEKTIGDGRVGPVAKKIMTLFRDFSHSGAFASDLKVSAAAVTP